MYTPNSIARSLKTARSMTVGVILPDLTNPLFPPMVRGIENALLPSGFTALNANTDNGLRERARAVVHALAPAKQVDGWISATATLQDHLFELSRPSSLVLLNRLDENGTPAVVGATTMAGIAAAVAHLVELGHRQIAYVGRPQELSTGAARLRAFTEVTRPHGLAGAGELIRIGESFAEHGRDSRTAALAAGLRARSSIAVVAGNDLMALGWLRRACRARAALP